MHQQPIPGLIGLDHVGLTVPDVDRATAFFVDVLGAEALYDIGPFTDPAEWMASHLARRADARIERMRVLAVANGPMLELFELSGAALETAGVHLAFYVEDMEAALGAVKAHGAVIQSGPVEMTEGPSAGLTWLYFTAPWGLQLELVSYPRGIAALRERKTPVWRPRR
ncbi:MAG TPA: VOC family protein [Hyphomicrobiaceae bacterium]|nr:VOC family protein [Hyphomicrobiaceae bacterium]